MFLADLDFLAAQFKAIDLDGDGFISLGTTMMTIARAGAMVIIAIVYHRLKIIYVWFHHDDKVPSL